MENSARILIVEDETDIASFIEAELTCEGYRVDVANDGMQGLTLARKINPDLIILDRLLPGLDGIEFCKRIRQHSDVPILMLTALDGIDDKVEGLDAGANDYLAKPFSLRELLARVRAQLRQKKTTEKTVMEYNDLSLDTSTREVLRSGRQINLTPKEFELLSLLLQNPRHVLTRESIFEKVWGWDYDGDDNVLEVLMHGLREKVEMKGLPKLIHTVRGIGYTLKEN